MGVKGASQWGNHSLYRLPNIFRMIKFRLLRWTGHVAGKEESRSAFNILTGKPTGILKHYLSKREIRLIQFRTGIVGEPLWMRPWTFGIHMPGISYFIFFCPPHRSIRLKLCDTNFQPLRPSVMFHVSFRLLVTSKSRQKFLPLDFPQSKPFQVLIPLIQLWVIPYQWQLYELSTWDISDQSPSIFICCVLFTRHYIRLLPLHTLHATLRLALNSLDQHR
jgi:hypothetical protein